MEIHWIKADEGSHNLIFGNETIGTIYSSTSNPVGRFSIANPEEKYLIRRIGFWRTTLEIATENNNIILRAEPEKWYASRMLFTYEGENFVLAVRNNPMAEWVIQYNNQDILAYGLHTQASKPVTRIKTGSVKAPIVFHFLLWHLFKPIALEATSDDMVFHLLLTAQ